MPSIYLHDRFVRDVPLEEAVLVSKNQKLAEVIRSIQKRRVDRVLVTADDTPIGVVTVKDIFSKLALKRMRTVSPTSLAISGLSSERLITAKPDENLLKAAQRLRDEGISSLPVVGYDDRVLGLLTKMNLILLLKNKHRAGVKDVMLSYVGTIDLSAKLSQALEHIKKSPVRELVVVDSLRPVAILGEREVALALFNLLSTNTIHHAEAALERLLVSDVMRRIKASISLQSDLRVMIDTLHSEMVNTLPVVQEGRVVGLVTRDGIFQHLLVKEESYR